MSARDRDKRLGGSRMMRKVSFYVLTAQPGRGPRLGELAPRGPGVGALSRPWVGLGFREEGFGSRPTPQARCTRSLCMGIGSPG